MSNDLTQSLVTVQTPGAQTVTYKKDSPVAIDIEAPKQVSVRVFETGPKGGDGLQGVDGITHAATTINTDSSRPIAYWGYLLASDNTQYIARLDYTSGQQPTVTRAAVTSVASSWARRSLLNYL